MAEKPENNAAMQELTARLEAGVREVFESGRFEAYLKTMTAFHNYSTRNTLLIYLQNPDATRCMGFRAWQEKFNRYVKKGEKGIKIYAPTAQKSVRETEKIDPETQRPVLDDEGNPVVEKIEQTIPRFRAVSIFDVSQTDGDPLPKLAEDITGDVRHYDLFVEALRAVSPAPITFDRLAPDTDGLYNTGDNIVVIRAGMSEVQTVSALVHEITHAKLHNADARPVPGRIEEAQAEGVSWAVCQHYGIETGANSFGYLATWSKNRDLKELQNSLDVIRKTASELIDGIDKNFAELAKARGVDLSVNAPDAPEPAKAREEPMQSTDITPGDKDFWRGQIADFLAGNGGKMELDDLDLPPTGNYGGLGKFYEVFGENIYKREFAKIVAQENTKRTGEPWAVFTFCEGGEYRPDFLRTPTAMLFSEADTFLRRYEPQVREILQADGGGYDKLDYTIYVKRDDNEVYPISDRYDVGDGKNISGLYNVIKAETDYYYAHPEIHDREAVDENPDGDRKLAYADIAILKNAVTREYPYVEIESAVRYADGDRLDQKIFNEGEILSFADADSKIKTGEKALRDKYTQKYGSPGDGDEELGIAVHFKLPGESEPRVFRLSYLLGDFNEENSGLLKHIELSASYLNFCVRNGDYGNVIATLGGKDANDAIRLAADCNRMYEVLRAGMPEPTISEERRGILIEAMRAAGYEYDSINSGEGYINFRGEYGGGDFGSFAEVEEWLEGIVFDDPDISDRVEAVLHPERFAEGDTVREQLAALSRAETPDAKYDTAFTALVGALCNNAELLALADSGAEWRHGAGRDAVYDGGHYEALLDAYGAELAELLADASTANRLRNTVKGEVYRRLDDVAHQRYILDEYADICKAGRLETYEMPYPKDSENKGVMVYLTERLPEGGVHDYGYIYGYDPDDTRDHPISNYLSLKTFSGLRESVFGKPETTVTLDFAETAPGGSTVLRPLLYTDGQFNREGKRTRVEVLPPMGKYSIYAQHLSGVTYGDDTLLHAATDSGYLFPLGVSRTKFEEDFIEAQIDRIFEKAPALLDAALANPTAFARYDWAAITGRFAEVEAHNAPVRKLRDENAAARREEAIKAEKEEQRQLQEKYDARVDEIAAAVGQGKTIPVGYKEYEFDGKNPVLDLFKLYEIALPLRTQGWVNTGLAEITESGYRYYKSKQKGDSSTFGGYLERLREAIRETPIDVKRGKESDKENSNKEVGGKTENGLYAKFAELFPDFLEQKYSYLRLESEGLDPLSLEWTFGDRISVMQTHAMNGDLMYDPMMEFTVNSADKTLAAVRFEQSMPPLCQYPDVNGQWHSADGNGRDSVQPNLQREINSIAAQWFKNLGEQSYTPVRATLWNNGGIDEVDVRVTFDKDGNMITPEPETAEPVGRFVPNAAMPDPSVTVAEMNEYGYTAIELLPLSQARALELYGSGNPVYLLYPDNTEAMAFDRDEIKNHEGLCGIERADWERSPVYRAQSAIEDNNLPGGEAARETAVTHVDTAAEALSVSIGEKNCVDLDCMARLTGFDREKLLDDLRGAVFLNIGNMTDQSNTYVTADEYLSGNVREKLAAALAAQATFPDGRYDINVEALKAVQPKDLEAGDIGSPPFADKETAREAELLHSEPGMFGIYQIKDGIDSARDFRFAPVRELEAHGLTPERANYGLVYTAPLTVRDTQTNLHRIFNVFQHGNPECPSDFSTRSVSVSDVIVLQWRGEVSAHYVDGAGFKELPSFTGKEKESPPTVADYEADVKAGKSVSVMGLAKALHAEQDNYLKTAEMSVEDDYGMIDGIINNGPKEPAEKRGVAARLNDAIKEAAELNASRTDDGRREKHRPVPELA